MRIRLAILCLLLSGGLGCATQPTTGRSHHYADGSYYAPGDGAGGDYYYAPEPRDFMVLPPGYHFGAGWPGLGYTGYCPARYRYCPSYFSFHAGYPYGFGWHDAFYRDAYFYRPSPRRRYHHYPRPPSDRATPFAPVSPVSGQPRRQESRVRAPERAPEREMAEPVADRPSSSPRQGRRQVETRQD